MTWIPPYSYLVGAKNPAAAKPAEIDVALVQRMVALVRDMSDTTLIPMYEHFMDEACRISKELPEPVDPDLMEARKVASEFGFLESNPEFDKAILDGRHDYKPGLLLALAAIKRGRQLEREAK